MMGEARRHGGTLALLLLAFALALALRLLVWHWHEFYPLGGDEQEYLHQALTLLREHRYEELRLMRPPLYGVFLAGTIYLFDSLVQRLRLVQAIISAATVVPVWLLTAELARWYRPAPSPPQPPTPNPQPPTPNPRPPGWPPLLAALLCALSYTLADYATELLTETLFLFGLTVLLWLLVRAAAPGERRPYSAAAAGLVLGALCLTRSVGVVLLPLGALWLLSIQTGEPGSERSIENRQSKIGNVLVFVLACALVILPWTVRNYATYGGFILVDTTGPENLWLDNDPAGREAVKAQLYALGDDRATRQQLATARGLEAITGHPQHFARKAWGELLAFFALEYTDDMLERPVIWVPPAEVWARLLLGDGLWLLALLAGVVGFCTVQRRPGLPPWADPRWLLGAWAGYTLLTALVFHVELRYRLPLYPVLLPYAAFALTRVGRAKAAANRPSSIINRQWAAGVLVVCIAGLMLLHRPYPVLAWHLAWKHLHLAQAEQHLQEGHSLAAVRSVRAALAHDSGSALARVAWAEAALLANDQEGAGEKLRETIALLPDHPLPHLLLGHLLRQRGDLEAARRHLAYETATLQDVQAWSWEHFRAAPPSLLDIGNGLDLGWIWGFHSAEAAAGTDWRWTTGWARLRLTVSSVDTPGDAALCAGHAPGTTLLHLRMAPGRPAGAPMPVMRVSTPDRPAQPPELLPLVPGWHDYTLRLARPASGQQSVVIDLRSDTFTPRAYDPASPDNRALGVMLDQAQILQCIV